MGCLVRVRRYLLPIGLVIAASVLALTVSAGPDPPFVDGGSTTFEGEWTVDPGDVLSYVNQTIVLDGNLTVEGSGVLELVNSTLVMNCTTQGEFRIAVLVNGTLRTTQGSVLSNGTTDHPWYAIVEKDAHLLIQDSTVMGAGYPSALGILRAGIFSEANDTLVRSSSFIDCYSGIALANATSPTISDDNFFNIGFAGIWIDKGSEYVDLIDHTFIDCGRGILVRDCAVNVTRGRYIGGNWGIIVENGWSRVTDGEYIGQVIAAIDISPGSSGTWYINHRTPVVNTTVYLNATMIFGIPWDGHLIIDNSSLFILSDGAGSTHAIALRDTAEMSVVNGSLISNGTTGHRFKFFTDPFSHLYVNDSVIEGVGVPEEYSPGLRLRSGSNWIRNSTIRDCYTGIIIDDSNFNSVENVIIRDCVYGLNLTAEYTNLKNLTFIDCEGRDLTIIAVAWLTLDGITTNSPDAQVSIYMDKFSYSAISNLSILGRPEVGIYLGHSRHLEISWINATVWGTAILVNDTMSDPGNITIDHAVLSGGNISVSIIDASGISLVDLDSKGPTTKGVSIINSTAIVLTSCLVEGPSTAFYVSSVEDIRFDNCFIRGSNVQVYMNDVENALMTGCLFTDGLTAVRLEQCENITTRDISIMNAEIAIDTIGTRGLTIGSCLLTGMNNTAIRLQNGSRDSVLVNLTVVSAPTAVHMTGDQTQNNRVENITVQNCPLVLNLTGVGPGNSLAWTTLVGVSRAVVVTLGSELVVTDCSIHDCPVFIETDGSSSVLFKTETDQDIYNSTLRMRGRFVVFGGGHLTLSHANVTFLDPSDVDAGIRSFPGSTLHIVNGSSIWGGGQLAPYTIRSEGTLVVRRSTISGGGNAGSTYALSVLGNAAMLVEVSFRDCPHALLLEGDNPFVINCTFIDDYESVYLNGTDRPEFTGCTFSASDALWAIRGTFTNSLVMRNCSFDGGGLVATGIKLDHDSNRASLTMANVTMSDYESRGLDDQHTGPLSMTDCRLINSDIRIGPSSANSIVLTRLTAVGSVVTIGAGGFVARDCGFTNCSLKVEHNKGGSLLTDCTFHGVAGEDMACVDISGSILITITDLSFVDTGVALRFQGASDVSVHRCSISGARGAAIQVNASIARFESCQISQLNGTGVRTWRTGSLAELRNCTIQAIPGSTGFEVDASGGGDVWLLNTTFDRSSIASSGGGRVEVLWFVTVEPSLPWGGVLMDPENLVVMDAAGLEVLNTSVADQVMRLYEFIDEDGLRTWRTPHQISISDTGEGVSYQGGHSINASVHLVLELADVAAPVARAGPDKVVDEDLVVTLDATSTSDNDPTFHTTGFYQWSFDDHGTIVVLTGDYVKHVFSVPGKYWINLTVTDWAGNEGMDSVIIQVRDVTPPDIRFTGNVTVDEDTWVIMDASATTDNEPSFDAQAGRFLWEVFLPEQTLTRTTPSFGHAFPEPGNYSGSLTVWDGADNQAHTAFWVQVLDITPPVIEGVSSAVVFEPSEGLLDASNCFDNVGIAASNWRVTFENETADAVELEGEAPEYLFDRLGMYTVELELVDDAGNENSTTISIVYDDLPVISLPDFAMAMVGETLTVQFKVRDDYSSGITLRVSDGPSEADLEGSVANPRLVWVPNATVSGSDVVIEVEVYDGFVASHDTIIVHVNPAHGVDNRPPVILSTPPLGAKMATPYIYSVMAEDPDGDMLGYMLVTGPPGMTISQGGTIAWDPPYSGGVHLVDVHLMVTDGRDIAEQTWTIRWRDPPNRPPSITFSLDPLEVGANEEFLVDLAIHVQDPDAYSLDGDDPNHALTWSATFDPGALSLVSQEGLLFRFRALDVPGDTQVDFVVVDPSGGSDTVPMALSIIEPAHPEDDGVDSWMLWGLLAAILALGLAGGAVAVRRRGGPAAGIEPYEGHPDRFGPPPDESSEGDEAIAAALVDADAEGVGAFVEVDKAARRVEGPSVARQAAPVPGGTRVVDVGKGGPRRLFQVEGVAVLGPGGGVTASTGKVEEVLGPYQESLDELRSKMGGQGSAVMEVEGRRTLIGMRGPVGLLCIIRGREDDAFRDTLMRRLDDLSLDSSTEAAVGVIEDVLAAAGRPERAEVVRDAWTSHLEASITYRGSVLVLGISLRNDTDHIMNNVRLRVVHDEDALVLDSITPKVLASHGKMALGNVPPRKQQELELAFVPELCISSSIRVMVNYTDVEGRTVHVPTRSLPVAVECPYVEAGGDVDEDRLLSMSEDGLGAAGRRVFSHGLDVDHMDLFRVAVRLVAERGPMKVMELEDESLMRAEAWFIGSGEGGSPRVLVRVSAHGADHLLEVFVTSEDGRTATGLLAFLSGEILDTAASQMPGKRVERVRDSATLEEISVWPSLLDYKVMGD